MNFKSLLDPDLHPILNFWRPVVFFWALCGIAVVAFVAMFIAMLIAMLPIMYLMDKVFP